MRLFYLCIQRWFYILFIICYDWTFNHKYSVKDFDLVVRKRVDDSKRNLINTIKLLSITLWFTLKALGEMTFWDE